MFGNYICSRQRKCIGKKNQKKLSWNWKVYVIFRAHSVVSTWFNVHKEADSNGQGRHNARVEGKCIICQEY